MTDDIRQLKASMQHAQQLGEQGRHHEAKTMLREARARCQALGIESAQLTWGLAVAADYSGCPEEALQYIVEVMRMDPLSTAGAQSLNIVVGRVRAALSDPERDPAHDTTPQSFALLLEIGEADTNAHVAMARHLAATGKEARALATLEAVVTLEPGNEDAWRALANVSWRCGRSDLSHRAATALVGLKTRRNGEAQRLGDGGVVAQA